MITQELLMKTYKYDQNSGVFTILKANRYRKVGDEAGTPHSCGYISLSVKKNCILAHRAAWLYVYGKLPNGVIDHINGDKKDNRITNLRDVTPSVNLQNRKRSTVKNTTGRLGVSYHKNEKKYRAVITLNGKSKHLGYFKDPDDAHKAYLQVKRALHVGCTI